MDTLDMFAWTVVSFRYVTNIPCDISVMVHIEISQISYVILVELIPQCINNCQGFDDSTDEFEVS